MEEEVAAEDVIGLGKDAGTQTYVPSPSKSVSVSGKEISESEMCCWNKSSSVVIAIIKLPLTIWII